MKVSGCCVMGQTREPPKMPSCLGMQAQSSAHQGCSWGWLGSVEGNSAVSCRRAPGTSKRANALAPCPLGWSRGPYLSHMKSICWRLRTAWLFQPQDRSCVKNRSWFSSIFLRFPGPCCLVHSSILGPCPSCNLPSLSSTGSGPEPN